MWAQAKALGVLGPPGTERDLALALIIARVCAPASKLASARWWSDTTLAADLGVDQASTDEVYAAMDWLIAAMARSRRPWPASTSAQGRWCTTTWSSSWMEGHCCPWRRGFTPGTAKGESPDRVRTFDRRSRLPGVGRGVPLNTADPTAFIAAVDKVRTKFNLKEVVMVGDRGMVTSARIDALKNLSGISWITSLRAPAIKALADAAVLELSLFDEVNLAERSHPDYPGERLVECRKPALAAERSSKRYELLAATEKLLAPHRGRSRPGPPGGLRQGRGTRGRAVNRYKMARHSPSTSQTNLRFSRKADQIAAEAALEGIYVIRTNVTSQRLNSRPRGRRCLQGTGQR